MKYDNIWHFRRYIGVEVDGKREVYYRNGVGGYSNFGGVTVFAQKKPDGIRWSVVKCWHKEQYNKKRGVFLAKTTNTSYIETVDVEFSQAYSIAKELVLLINTYGAKNWNTLNNLKNTFVPTNFSMSRRALLPIIFNKEPPSPITIAFWPSRSTQITALILVSVSPSSNCSISTVVA